MFDLLFPNRKDIEALFGMLGDNPLLASLLMISPLEAFKLLNIMPQFLAGFLPTAGEDAPLAEALIQALRAGRTTLEQPQVIAFEQPQVIVPAPPAEAAATLAPPALTLSIATPMLQQALQLYAHNNFEGKEFVFPAQSWMDVTTRGESIALDLQHGRARIVARLQGTMAIKLAGRQFDLKSQRASFPIEVRVLAALKVDPQDRLFVHVTDGAVSIGRTPLPARLANDLVAQLTKTIGSIPIVQVPTRFEIPGEPPAALAMHLTTIGIDQDGLKLDFSL